MQTNTFIAVPTDVQDPTVLKRFLDVLVEKIDVAYSNRGEDGFTSNSQTLSVATNLNSLVEDVNRLSRVFIPLEGSSDISGKLTYSGPIQLTGNLDIVTKEYVDTKYTPQTAPTLLASSSSAAEVKAIADKLDDLINILKNVGILT